MVCGPRLQLRSVLTVLFVPVLKGPLNCGASCESYQRNTAKHLKKGENMSSSSVSSC